MGKDGDTLDCDLAVLSAGIRPNVDLTRMAGLHVRRSILVNDELTCRNDQDIYAIGECAEHRSMVLITKAPEVFAVSDMSLAASHNLGNAAQIPLGEGRRFDIDGVGIAVFRSRRGRVYAAQAECPHRAGPLADGLLGGEALICPLHNFRSTWPPVNRWATTVRRCGPTPSR
ncbi:MAG: FAD-dependent oxidoreductase [Chloroflexota bacterium]|nr:FAD-dependent oxidoreductase [Chloroflexota bacterium]MDE2958611.1 FAD-dependent oxidoreductase [Chloroflexota bacterium]